MRTWARARRHQLCGRCGGHIDVGEPIVVLTGERFLTPKVRCQRLACADEPVPADLPEVSVAAPVAVGTPDVMTRVGLLALDWTPTAQAMKGRREPGEEG